MGKLTDFFTSRREGKDIRYILSIDGGGMRGIIPAYILSKIDALVKERGDKRPLYAHFDLVAGTSTGALLALGLTAPAGKSALRRDSLEPFKVFETHRKWLLKKEERFKGYILPSTAPDSLSDFYLRHGSRIFPRTTLNALSQLFQVKYDEKPLEAFLLEQLGHIRLDEALSPTLAVAYDCPNARPYVFRSYDSHGYLSREAARASTAAPLYFPPAIISDRQTGEKLILSDGGLVANNPAMIAYIEAKRLYPDADEFRILSLSTCKRAFSFDPSRISGGAASWASNITRVYSNAQENLVNEEIASMNDVRYLRIYSDVLERRIALDDTSKESLDLLQRGAEKAYENQRAEIEGFAQALAESSTRDSVRLFQSP